MNHKKILYIDMDGVLVDLETHYKQFFVDNPHLEKKFENCPDHIPGIFRDPPPYEDCIEAVHKLYESDKYDKEKMEESELKNEESSGSGVESSSGSGGLDDEDIYNGYGNNIATLKMGK